MLVFKYDKTFEGLLTGVFDAFSRKTFPDMVIGENDPPPLLFDELYEVLTDTEKSARVWNGLNKKLSKDACRMLTVTFLSELPDIEMLLFDYIRKAFGQERSIETNFGDDTVLKLSKIFRQVNREAERMRQFVRFSKVADGLFFAPFDPLYNVLPLARSHFEDRFSDQQWIIYDIRRNYGLYYDLKETIEIKFDNPQFDKITGKLSEDIIHEDERLFSQLWKDYLKALTIKERTNLKLQRSFMPKRFWKYLTEKN